MAQDDRTSSALMRNLHEALNRIPAVPPDVVLPGNPGDVSPAYARLKLQPVSLQPGLLSEPRLTSAGVAQGQYGEPPLPPVSADDDLPMEAGLDDEARKSRGSIFLASVVVLAGAAAMAAFVFFLSPPEQATGPLPEIRADPAALVKAPDPSVEADKPEAVSQQPVDAPRQTTASSSTAGTPVSMGEVSTELVAPTTDGLSPARKIGTIKILLDGDREIKPQ
jgi:hypothetical protein